ncbi:MAG: NrfD/PsrC family molybdoenzyme membrane anchor subunit [Anaerolineae bacterium]
MAEPTVKEQQAPAVPVDGGAANGHDPDPLIAPGQTMRSVTDKILGIVLQRHTPWGWVVGFAIAFVFTMGLMMTITWLLWRGVGIWGNQIPVGWAFDIINFVWWIGIGHAGTLISAILLLLVQPWRTAINRFAEAMTLFAVACAGLFPLLHTGRPWYAFWMLPYPATTGMWPQFRSPLLWDVFAVTTYLLVSIMFWYTGLVPDLASLRDKTKRIWIARTAGIFALGWRNSARHWARHGRIYYLMAAISTPLVLSVHSIVSFDFAVSILPGWHATIFPPYFVAGAIYAGFAMVLTLMIPLRRFYDLKGLVTARHVDNMAKVMLVSGLVVAYGYTMEFWTAYYSGNLYERQLFFWYRPFGPYWMVFWGMILCNIIVPQALWFRFIRRNTILLWIVAMFVNFGMWFERFNIIVTSLAEGFLPATWRTYTPTQWDFSMFFGTIGMFLALIFLFVRFLPMISVFEVREEIEEDKEHEAAHAAPQSPALAPQPSMGAD